MACLLLDSSKGPVKIPFPQFVKHAGPPILQISIHLSRLPQGETPPARWEKGQTWMTVCKYTEAAAVNSGLVLSGSVWQSGGTRVTVLLYWSLTLGLPDCSETQRERGTGREGEGKERRE